MKTHRAALILACLLPALPARAGFGKVEPAANWIKVSFEELDGSVVEGWCERAACLLTEANAGKTSPLYALAEETDPQKTALVGPTVSLVNSVQIGYQIQVVHASRGPRLVATRAGGANSPKFAATAVANAFPGKKNVEVLSPTNTTAPAKTMVGGLEEAPDCRDGELLGYYTKASPKTPGSAKAFGFWLPMELELVIEDNLYKIDAQDAAYFRGQFKNDFKTAAAEAAAPGGTESLLKARDLAAAMRSKVQNEAAAMRSKLASSSSASAFTAFESQFLLCRMGLAGKKPAFSAKLRAAEAASADKPAFVRYWRAFTLAELSMYAADSGSVPKGAPLDFQKFHGDLVQRTADALAEKDRPGLFARAGIPDSPAGVTPEPKKKRPEVAGTPVNLSSSEEGLLTPDEDKAYVAALASAESAKDPDFKKGDKSKEDVVSDYRKLVYAKPALSLSDQELASFGDGAADVKKRIEAAPTLDARRDLVSKYRAAAPRAAQLAKAGDAKSLDLLKHIQQDPGYTAPGVDGNNATGTVPGAPVVYAGGNGNGKNSGADPNNTPEKLQNSGLTGPASSEPPTPGQDKVASSDDGGKSWKKQMPLIGAGVKWGIWMAVLGMFFGGPMGVFVFGALGFSAGYISTKISKSLD